MVSKIERQCVIFYIMTLEQIEKPSGGHSEEEESPEEMKKERISSPFTRWEKLKYKTRVWAGVGIIAFSSACNVAESFDTKQTPQEFTRFATSNSKEQVDQDNFQKMAERVHKKIPSSLDYIKMGYEVGREEQADDSKEIEFVGFEEIDISEHDLKEMWNEKRYPTALLEGVDEVRFVNEQEIKDGGRRILARADRGKDKVMFFQPKIEEGKKNKKEHLLLAFDMTFSHEIGHLNDWASDNDLDPVERVDFLDNVITEMEKEEGYKTRRTEMYDNIRRKASEWWADLVSAFFQDPTELKNDYPTSYALAEKWIVRGSDFDPKEALAYQEALLDIDTDRSIANKSRLERISEKLSQVKKEVERITGDTPDNERHSEDRDDDEILSVEELERRREALVDSLKREIDNGRLTIEEAGEVFEEEYP